MGFSNDRQRTYLPPDENARVSTNEAEPTALTAARNNAEWCDVLCRTHEIAGTFHSDAWTSAHRTPPLYPDAVTLTSSVDVARLLPRIDSSAGCSVKDSFATLDLTEHDFRVLFDAQWIVRAPSPPAPVPASANLQWRPVHDADELARWEHARDGTLSRLFRPALLVHEAVTVLAAFDDERIVAGAITNRSETVVGVSNFFSTKRNRADVWNGCVAHITREHSDLAVVGYESGDALTGALTNGFTALGPLRVWIRER